METRFAKVLASCPGEVALANTSRMNGTNTSRRNGTNTSRLNDTNTIAIDLEYKVVFGSQLGE